MLTMASSVHVCCVHAAERGVLMLEIVVMFAGAMVVGYLLFYALRTWLFSREADETKALEIRTRV